MSSSATAPERTQDSIYDDEIRYRGLFDASTDVLIILDERGVIIGANRTAEQHFERKQEQLRGTAFDALPSLSVGFDEIDQSLASADRFQREMQIDEGASVRHAELRATVSCYEEDRQILVSIRDITSQKQMQEQLYRADRLASLGTMAAGVAHEINNPLSFIISNLEVTLWELDDDEDPDLDDIREAVARAKRGAERVERTVRDLTNFSHGGLDDSIEPVNIHRMLDLAAQMVEKSIQHKGGKLIKSYGDIPRVLANEARLNQVFVNLLLNAAQALPERDYGENVVEMTTSVDEDKNVVVAIRDTGTGIPEEIRNRIFDPFFTTKPVDQGTGIGLAICHEIVQAIGGEIFLDTRVGEGTTFEVVLPTGVSSLEPPADA